MNRAARPAPPTPPAARRPIAAWLAGATAPLVAVLLLTNLVQACEESVRQGERLRAEQRATSAATTAR